jgi:hypothetical protein
VCDAKANGKFPCQWQLASGKTLGEKTNPLMRGTNVYILFYGVCWAFPSVNLIVIPALYYNLSKMVHFV